MKIQSLSTILVLSAAGSAVVSAQLSASELCMQACHDTVALLPFSTAPPPIDDQGTPSPEFLCSSFLPVSSMYACYASYCRKGPRKDAVDLNGFGALNGTCGGTMPSYNSIMRNVDLKQVSVANTSDVTAVYNGAVVPPLAQVTVQYQSLSNDQYMRHLNHVYTRSLYAVVSIIALAAITARVLNSYSTGRGDGSAIGNFLRGHITLPATFGYRHAEFTPLGKIPTRMESIIVFVYVAYNLILLGVGFPQQLPEEVRESYKQNWDRVYIRAISLAVGNLPLMFLFAGRNNFLIWLTGIPYSTFNLFHRWTARIFSLQATIHASHLILFGKESGWAAVWAAMKEQYLYCGFMAFWAIVAINLTGSYQIRKRVYEIFVWIHIPLALVALVGIFLHTKQTNPKKHPYLFVCIGFWVFDRVLRVARLLYAAIFWKSITATATLEQETGMIRIRVRASDCTSTMGKALLGAAPGQHYFLYTFTGPLSLLENHPFSLESWGANVSQSDACGQGDIELATPEKWPSPPSRGSESSSRSIIGHTNNSNVSSSGLQFMIKPRGGMTSRLRNQIVSKSQNGQSSATIRIGIEGPYGVRHNLQKFDRVLLLAGGSGITAVLPYARELSNSKLVWSTREFQNSYLDELLAGVPQAVVHISGKPLPDMNRPGFEFREVRIDVRKLIHESASGMEDGSGISRSLAVVCCGPGKMCDDVRLEIVGLVGNRNVRVEYFEENFGW